METLLDLSLNFTMGFSATVLVFMLLSFLPAQQPSAIAIPIRSRES